MKEKIQKQNFRNKVSRVAGYFARISKPRFIVRWVILLYIKIYKIDISKFVVPDKFYKNFNDFFTRRYKENFINIENGFVSPIDGTLLDKGLVSKNQIIHVKNRDYYLADLLGHSVEGLNSYAVLYLAPGDYHRVHSSFDMTISKIMYLPGTLRSVKVKVINKRDRVYCRNERIVIAGDSEYGKFYFILIGALLVGKVKLAFDSGLSTNIRKGIATELSYEHPIKIKKGEEVGYFELGSSLVVVMEKDMLNNINPEISQQLYLGKRIIKKV